MAFDVNSELSDVIHDDNYFTNSSCFLFHIDGSLRRFCLSLAEPRVHFDEVIRIRDRIPDYKIKVPLLEQKEGEYKGMDQSTLSSFDMRNRVFDNVILLMILISSAMLPLDSPLNDPSAPNTKLIAKINVCFTLCFLTEASIKIIAKGFLFNNMKD